METNNNLISLYIAKLQSNNAKKSAVVTQTPDSKKDMFVTGSLAVGSTSLGTAIGYGVYRSDKLKTKKLLKKAESQAQSPELSSLLRELKDKFIDLITREKAGTQTVFPNNIMLVGENPELNESLIKWLGNNSKCNFVQTNHTESVLDKLNQAKSRHQSTGERTLIHVKGFDQLLNPEVVEDDDVIEGFKAIMDKTSKNYHSTIIFTTTDTSKLDQTAIQSHRVEEINVRFKKHIFDAMETVEELTKKLKNFPKTKILIGAAIGLFVGILGVSVKNSVLSNTNNLAGC